MIITATNLVTGAGIALGSNDQKYGLLLTPGKSGFLPDETRDSVSVTNAVNAGLITITFETTPGSPIIKEELDAALAGFSPPLSVTTLTGPIMTPDASITNVFDAHLTQNTTLTLPSTMANGQVIIIRLLQDPIGGRAVTFNSGYKFPSGIVPTVTPSANAQDMLTVVKVAGVYLSTLVQDVK